MSPCSGQIDSVHCVICQAIDAAAFCWVLLIMIELMYSSPVCGKCGTMWGEYVKGEKSGDSGFERAGHEMACCDIYHYKI